MLLALLVVVAAHAVALTHLIGHTAQGDNAHCAICVSAGHAGHAVPSDPLPLDLAILADRRVVPEVAGLFHRSPPAAYRSRAPPAFA